MRETGEDHVRFQQQVLEADTLGGKLREHGTLRADGRGVRLLERMVALGDHLWLDDGKEARLLAERREACQGVGIDRQAKVAGAPWPDREHGPPFREASTQAAVLSEALSQPVEPVGHRLDRRKGEGLGAEVDLDARNGATRLEQTGKGCAVGGRLADRLVDEDHAADLPADAGRP